jgi:hypothetical protein
MGLAYSYFVPNTFTNVFLTLCVFSLMQTAFVYISAFRTINFTDFNKQRAYYLAEEYLKSHTILDIKVLNRKEKFFFTQGRDIKFSNYPLERLLVDKDRINRLIKIFRNTKFLVYPKDRYLYVYIHIDAEQIDIFLALLYAMHLKNFRNLKGKISSDEELYIVMEECVELIKNINRQKLIASIESHHYHLKFEKLEEKYLRYNII